MTSDDVEELVSDFGSGLSLGGEPVGLQVVIDPRYGDTAHGATTVNNG